MWLVIGLRLCGRGLWRGVACDCAWAVWAWLMEGAWLVIALGLCGRGLWRGIVCDWAWLMGAWLMEGARLIGRIL